MQYTGDDSRRLDERPAVSLNQNAQKYNAYCHITKRDTRSHIIACRKCRLDMGMGESLDDGGATTHIYAPWEFQTKLLHYFFTSNSLYMHIKTGAHMGVCTPLGRTWGVAPAAEHGGKMSLEGARVLWLQQLKTGAYPAECVSSCWRRGCTRSAPYIIHAHICPGSDMYVAGMMLSGQIYTNKTKARVYLHSRHLRQGCSSEFA